ncbi:ComEC/Rec2 family competence protein [Portibacter marinus]|uniref:hypothetical protein n=1 Tax=Portibacter marinus TaxID=2898660 RepID=UPI001F32DBD0|nr:hypothetical protein [Portibacter marinus]
MSKINRCKVRMYRAGTGDCFLLKFYAGRARKFTMMIDGGVWQGSEEYLRPFAENIMEACDGKLDLLVITHEHRDHVLMFDRCKSTFKDLEINQLWFGWTEEDGDKDVEEWKEKFGDKKKALHLAAMAVSDRLADGSMQMSLAGNYMENAMYDARFQFSEVLNGFSDLHVSGGVYKGALKGMEVIKNQLNVKSIRYCKQGEIIRNLNNLEGIHFYVLGPPNVYEQVKKEHGKAGESYDHNKDIEDNELFSLAILRNKNGPLEDHLLPFDREFLVENDKLQKETLEVPNTENVYNAVGQEWRKIDYNWLFSAGNLALRMNSLTNNLSLALAIEFEESGKVMLFPGDAEFGSWESWHKIKWPVPDLTTEKLLNRTVFYKVAHHLSHNGTAASLGLEMMTHEDLVAMATLDFSNISNGWKSTMPNRQIIKELLKRTKGRLILVSEDEIFYDFNQQETLESQIKKAQQRMNDKEKLEFEKDLDKPKPTKLTRGGQTFEKELYFEYSVDGRK